LLASVSSLALIAGSGLGQRANAASPFRSLAQALAGASVMNSAANPSTGIRSAQQAAIGVQNLQAASARFESMQQALASQAATAAGWSQTVPNGLTVGGLQPASGYNVPGSTVWLGTDQSHPITQTISDGNTVVTINQVLPQAILNWQSFNIGSHTAVHFNQSAGKAAASTWTVLNRISDPTVSPTQILGSITAEGQVLVLNQNGVLFAPGSQVNLHSLAAGAVTMTDKQFLTNGIYSPTPTTPVFLGAAGNVTVEPGAEIATNTATSVSSGGGAVILLGRSVVNDGYSRRPDRFGRGELVHVTTGLKCHPERQRHKQWQHPRNGPGQRNFRRGRRFGGQCRPDHIDSGRRNLGRPGD